MKARPQRGQVRFRAAVRAASIVVRREREADSWQMWGSSQRLWQARQEGREQVGERHWKRRGKWWAWERRVREVERRAVGLGR